MHDTATDHVVLLRIRPADGPAALVFTTVGCLGQIGMNEAGVCVGINNLLAADGQPGVMWPSVVREVLSTPTTEAARDTVLAADLAGGHSFLLFDGTGTGFVVEAMPTARPYTKLEGRPLVHTNHTVLPEACAVEGQLDPAVLSNSVRRMERANELLDQPVVTVDDLMEATRDSEAICRTSMPPRHVESSGAVVMRPATGEFWAVWGLPLHNDYMNVPFLD
jgi:isopenicillin-N N-acyltransferase-like protein